jgi:clan AA aspartic protease (TIGR02281 family)
VKLVIFLIFILSSLACNIPGKCQTKLYLQEEGGVYYIPCVVNGLNMKLIFDSGAADVSISLTEANFMLKNKFLSEDNIVGTEYYKLANGQIQEGTKIILNSIIIGGHELKNIEASIVHTLNAPLLLGQSALSKLGSISFDYSDNSLTINGSKNNTSIPKIRTPTIKPLSDYTGSYRMDYNEYVQRVTLVIKNGSLSLLADTGETVPLKLTEKDEVFICYIMEYEAEISFFRKSNNVSNIRMSVGSGAVILTGNKEN